MSGIKVKVFPQFPEQVRPGPGLDVTKQAGNWMVQLDYNQFGVVDPYTPQDGHFILTFDTNTSQFVLVPANLSAVPAIWDSTTAHNVTVSNANVTATNNSNVADQGVTIPVASAQSAGRFYFEIQVTTNLDSGWSFGVATIGTAYSALTANGASGVACYQSGSIFTNGSDSLCHIGSMINGDVIGVAVDLNVRNIWFKPVKGSQVGSGWNGIAAANPTGNIGGIPVLNGIMVPYVSFTGAVGALSGNALTADFGVATFAGAVPQKFVGGWPSI
jgi:hypothetical protein